jgi:phosphatidylglycerophosphate synthase
MLTLLSHIPTRQSIRQRLLGLTLIRLALIPAVIATFMSDPIVTTGCLGLFMILDLGDGVLARRFGVEDVQRRALDSTVDRLAIDSCLVGAAIAGALPPLLLVLFLTRDAYCAAICARMVHERRVVIKADIVYRALNGSLALWGLSAPFVSPGIRTGCLLLIFAVSILVAIDLSRSVALVRAAPANLRDQVVSASVARRQVAEARSRRARREEDAGNWTSDVPAFVR